MATTLEETAGIRVVDPGGDLLGARAAALRRRVGEAIVAHAPQVVLDLRRTRRVSAPALVVLASCVDELRRRGGDLKLLGPRPTVRRLLDLCGKGALFHCLTSEAEIAPSFGLRTPGIRRHALRGSACPEKRS